MSGNWITDESIESTVGIVSPESVVEAPDDIVPSR